MISALGGIYSPQCKETLVELLKHDGNTTKAAVIQALSKQDIPNLVGLISPYLAHRSRPVVRATVLALSSLGSTGNEAISAKATTVMNRIGYDRPSTAALTKLLGISSVAEMQEVHQYFAKRFERLSRDLKRWQNQANRGYSYYWRRRETRARERVVEYMRLASTHLRPPFHTDLINSIKSILRTEPESNRMTSALGQTPLAREIKATLVRKDMFEQTYLSSYR